MDHGQIKKFHIGLVICTLVILFASFLNIISNIMAWQLNEFLDYTKFATSLFLFFFSSISLNRLLEERFECTCGEKSDAKSETTQNL